MAVKRTIPISVKEKVKYVRILATGNQFQGSSPASITLQAKPYGFTPKAYAWYKGTSTTAVGTSSSFSISNSQVATVEVYKVVVTSQDNQKYEDTISISKVKDGGDGQPGKQGQMVVQREWTSGDVYRNNTDVIDYIYHRATDTWWRLKDGLNNVTAGVNPSNQFVKLTSLEQLAVRIIVAEQANLAGFIFKDQKLVSQEPSLSNPNLILDGILGKIIAKDAEISGRIEALFGSIGGFRIENNNIVSNDRKLEISSQDGLKFRDNELRDRITIGVDNTGVPSIKFFDEQGNETWSAGTSGIIYTNYIAESYTTTIYTKASDGSTFTEPMARVYLDVLFKEQLSYWSSTGMEGFEGEYWTVVEASPGTVAYLYSYHAGKNPESEHNKQYEGYYYKSNNKLGSKVDDGWYITTGSFERGYGRRLGFSMPGQPPVYETTSPTFTRTFHAVRIVNGKVTHKSSFTAQVNLTTPGPGQKSSVPYSQVIIGQTTTA